MPDALTILREARELVRGGWCQSTYAKTRYGHRVGIGDSDAVRFCPYGATAKVGRCSEQKSAANLALEAALPPGFNSVATWNDAPGRTQAEVVALFTRALGRLEGTGGG